MATTINKHRVLNQLLAAAPGSEPETTTLPVLEQFIYGLCRSDASPEQADRAFKNLRAKFFDWNEIRVSSVREIEDALIGLGNTESRAQRLLSFLQEVFETTFSFDLDLLLKKGLKQAAKQIQRYQAADDYLVAWVTQRSLAGHAIPVDQATLRIAQRLQLVGDNDDVETARGSLEHLVPKAKGVAFTEAVSRIAEESCWENEPACGNCSLCGECPSAQETPERLVRPKPR